MLEYKMTVMPHTTQCDFNNELRASGIVDILQDCARLHIQQLGYDDDAMKKLGYCWVLTYETYELVSRMPKLGEILKVNTWPHEKRKLEYDREIEIRDQNDNLLIKAYTNWVIIDREKRTLTRAPEVIISGEFKGNINYEGPCKRKLILGNGEILDTHYHKVSLTDLDANLHANNAKYLDFIMNSINLENYKFFKKVELAFVHEARLNDEIRIEHFINEANLNCYRGYVGDLVCFEAIIEF